MRPVLIVCGAMGLLVVGAVSGLGWGWLLWGAR
jgi:hypothetical protein